MRLHTQITLIITASFVIFTFFFLYQSAYAQNPKYTPRERFGFVFNIENCAEGCPERNIDEFNYEELNAGWYLDGGYGFREPLGGKRDDISYVAMIGSGSRYNAPSSPNAQLCKTLANTIVNRYPYKYSDNMLWVIGNELGWDDQRTFEDYASEFVKWRTCLKSINPTFQIGTGAVIEMNMELPDNDQTVSCVPISNPNSGYNYFKNYITTIKNTFGTDNLPDFITMHGYTPCNTNNVYSSQNWGDINLLKISISLQRQAMKEVGLQNKDLIIKEIGPLPKDATNNMSSYLTQSIDFMLHEKDDSIGNPDDEGRLVQKFAWFVFNNWKGTNYWDHLELFDTNTTQIKPLGTTYKNVNALYTAPTITPINTPNLCPRKDKGNLNCSFDGCINQEDLTIFINYFGKSIPSQTPSNQSSPDLYKDQSAIIDTSDFEILRQNYNTCQ